MSLTSSSSSLLITCPYHLNLASLTFSQFFAMPTTPHLLISSFHNVSDQLSFISSYHVSIPSQPCFPHLLLVLHLFLSFISFYPSSLFIMCPYHLNLTSLIIFAMSTTPHLLISSLHNVSDQLSFISSYYVSISSQPYFPHHLCNVYHPTSSDLFIP